MMASAMAMAFGRLVFLCGKTVVRLEGATLPHELSRSLFRRDGRISKIEVIKIFQVLIHHIVHGCFLLFQQFFEQYGKFLLLLTSR